MDHGQHADGPGGEAPGVLIGIALLTRLLRVLKYDLEHLGEVLTKMVRRGTLQQEETERDTVCLYCLFSHRGKQKELNGITTLQRSLNYSTPNLDG